MATQRIISDKDFGQITIRTRRTARNITLRAKDDGLYITTPPRSLTSKVLEIVDKHRHSLLENWTNTPHKNFNLEYRIEATCFRLRLDTGRLNRFMLKFTEEEIILYCPAHTNFTSEATQRLIRNAIIRALKKSAQAYLPLLLNELAERYGFKYKKVKISGSKSRWGSCSSIGSINLSCYLMLLPPHLMDYVLLHELTHTKEMNHGAKFWEILDKLTEGRAHALRKELRKFHASF